MSNQPTVAVSIINYNSKQFLKKLLKNIFDQKYDNLEIFLVDNDSPDKGGAELKKEFSKIQLIESKDNGGFAKGHNLALKKINADYVILINPDIEMPNDTISKMVDFMEQNPKCGVASCKIVGFDGVAQSNGGDLPIGTAILSWVFNLEMIPGAEDTFGNFHRVDENYYASKKEVGWVGGTLMMIRHSVLQKAGLLPEAYFMYVEDVDFCYQAQKKGFKVMINPEVTIKHASGASSKDPRFAQFKGEISGLEIFYRRHFGPIASLMLKLLLLISTLARIIAFTLVGKPKIAQTYWRVLSYV